MLSENMLLWLPRYTLTSAIARALMDIEAARAVVEQTPLPPAAEAELRHRARIRSTHYSTSIEGNRLTLAEAEQVVEGKKAQFHGRERDVDEVKNYWNALLRVEEWTAKDETLRYSVRGVPAEPEELRRSEIYRQYIDSLSAIHEGEK
jgi:Fic family protein